MHFENLAFFLNGYSALDVLSVLSQYWSLLASAVGCGTGEPNRLQNPGHPCIKFLFCDIDCFIIQSIARNKKGDMDNIVSHSTAANELR